MKFDITDRLMANENPVIVISGEEIEINASAKDVLRLMELTKTETDLDSIKEAQKILFSPADIEKIEQYPAFIWTDIVSIAIEIAISGKLDTEAELDPKQTPDTI